MRKLASVQEIADIRAIEGADKIEVATVLGWQVVVAKSENFKVGDKIIYVETDSIMPEKPEFEFLRERKFRVKIIKLRKQVSEGLVLPLSILPDGKYEVGDDLTQIIGVRKHDPQAEQEAKETTRQAKNPIIKFLMRFLWFRKFYIKPKKGGFPAWIVKTDEDRIQVKTAMFKIEKELGTKFSVTEKLDGQSVTIFLERIRKNKFEFGVCSRNLRLKQPNNSSWWTIAKQIDAENVLKEMLEDVNGHRIVLQGEIIGTGIQGNKYKIDGYDFYAFNLIIDGKKLPTEFMQHALNDYSIKTVPILDTEFKLLEDIPTMVEYAKGDSVLLKTKREGVVIRSYERNISFKVISPDFLLAEKD